MNRRQLAIVLAVALAAAGCGSEGPTAGELDIRLASPNADDRAILLKLVGAQTAVTAPSGTGYRVFHGAPVGDTVRVLVVAPAGGHLAPGTVVRVAVPDTRQVTSYVATLQEATSTTYAYRATSGYALTVVKTGTP